MKDQLKLFILSFLSIFAPIESVILTALGLVLADLILGILASRKRGEKITSAGFRRTITKIFIYEIAIMLSFVTEKWLTGDLVPVQKIVTAFIGLTELKSIIENLNDIQGGSVFKSLADKLNNKVSDLEKD